MALSKPISREDLTDAYITRGLTQDQCAAMFNVSRWHIRKQLDIHEIALRPARYGRKGLAKRAGYFWVYQPGHPMANQRGYVHLAVIEWETVHERPFPEGMEPHHLNGVKTDDRPENILPLTHAEHTAISTWKRRGNPEKAAEIEARLVQERNA